MFRITYLSRALILFMGNMLVFHSASYASELSFLSWSNAITVNGNATTSDTFLYGGVSTGIVEDFKTSATTPISDDYSTIKFTIYIDPSDVGQQADLLIVYGQETELPYDGGIDTNYFAITNEGDSSTFIDLYANAKVWVAQLADNPFYANLTLQEAMPIEFGLRGSIPLMYYVFAGYRLHDTGKIVYSTKPVMLQIETKTILNSDRITGFCATPPNSQITCEPYSRDPSKTWWCYKPLGFESGEVSTNLLWENGSTLKVAFDFQGKNFVGDAEVCRSISSKSECEQRIKNEVIDSANTWSQYGNIYFQFDTPWEESDIRVLLVNGSGGYSHVGINALSEPKEQNTMQLGVSSGLKRTATHEFGHAIGFRHEHQSPSIPYTWNKEQVIKDTSKLFGWSEEKTIQQILTPLTELHYINITELFSTEYDPYSIMVYPIPSSWVSASDKANLNSCPSTDPNYCVEQTRELSETDKWTVAQVYPFEACTCPLDDPSKITCLSNQEKIQLEYIYNENNCNLSCNVTVCTESVKNQLPIADYSISSNTGEAPLNIFLASFSYDPDGSVVSHQWTIGEKILFGKTVLLTLDEPGNYFITLTVTDDKGATDTKSGNITVTEKIQPTSEFCTTGNANVNNINISCVNGKCNSAGIKITCNSNSCQWCDADDNCNNILYNGKTSITDGSINCTNGRCSYSTQNGGSSSSGSFSCKNNTVITNQPPVASFTISPNSGTAPLKIRVDASSSNDPDGRLRGYEWQTSNGLSAGGLVDASFYFATAGNYTITLIVIDDQGAIDSTSQVVTVNP